jgi:hypothetical protein
VGVGLLHCLRRAGGPGLTGAPGSVRHRTRFPLALLLPGMLAGCLGEGPPPTDPELAEALGLPPATPVHRVTLSGRGDTTRVLPSLVRVAPGALVQFVTADRRVYSVRFDLDALPPEAREFLRESRQEASPPLVQEGARFVVSLEGAPPGRYPFRVEGYGPTVEGWILVDPEG